MDQQSTILIVDDEPAGRDTLESMLFGQGYNLAFAENGAETLRKAAALTPDLILLDVMMPDMDGFEVCRRLRAEKGLAEVPIILVTALDDQVARLQGIEAGADDFITKPCNRAELRARVRTITRLNRYRRLLQAEEKVHEQAALLDIAQDAMIVHDLDNKITYWNRSAENLYGWSAVEAIGKNANDLIYGDTLSLPVDALDCVMKKGSWTGELHHRGKDEEEIVVESRWTLVLDSSGRKRSIFIINTDITEKKRFQAQFLRSQRMENLGTLASGIAHDLNNVLAPILMSVQMLRKKLPDERSQKILTTLETTTQRGANLVKQVLSFARGLEGRHTTVQVKHLILELEKILRQIIPRSIQVCTNISKELWTISSDSTQLHQILMNLCVNARDAMPNGGELSITAENFLADENYARMQIDAKAGPYIIISVSDTGTGIAPEILDRIFDPFFTTKEVGKGTGLGLSTVLGIIKSHGGFVNVYSEWGKGTEFKVYLPAIEATETYQFKEEYEGHDELPFGHGELILIVDDEASIREITKVSLETYSYRTLTASDGAEAVALYAQYRNEVSAVLTDMMMPIMDGPTTIRALQWINPDIKIIAVSGLAMDFERTKIASLGIKTILRKPYTTVELLKTLHKVFLCTS
jgi:two-component system, cell cycle sensor histidine kinase and response regulator CckA